MLIWLNNLKICETWNINIVENMLVKPSTVLHRNIFIRNSWVNMNYYNNGNIHISSLIRYLVSYSKDQIIIIKV